VQQLVPWVNDVWIRVLIYAVTLSVVWSGLDYVVTWSRRARQNQ
jgi:hypothetical protein